MNVALFVNPLLDPTGEFRCKDSNYRAYTQQDEELEDILYLGAHLSLKHMYTVDDILFDVKWEEGYIGIKYQCHLETCNFEMHVTLVKWPADTWRQDAVYSPHYDGIPDLAPVQQDFSAWALDWRARFRNINALDAYAAIAAKKYGGGWRCILETRNQHVKEMLRLAQNQLENVLGIGNLNVVKNIHFSLDNWNGGYPVGIKAPWY